MKSFYRELSQESKLVFCQSFRIHFFFSFKNQLYKLSLSYLLKEMLFLELILSSTQMLRPSFQNYYTRPFRSIISRSLKHLFREKKGTASSRSLWQSLDQTCQWLNVWVLGPHCLGSDFTSATSQLCDLGCVLEPLCASVSCKSKV